MNNIRELFHGIRGFGLTKTKPKENIMLWKVLFNALHTRDKLLSRGIITYADCLLCGRRNESISHLFFACSYVHNLWKRILAVHNFHIPSRDPFIEWARLFKDTQWRTDRTNLLLKLLKKVIYAVWEERNIRFFKEVNSPASSLLQAILEVV